MVLDEQAVTTKCVYCLCRRHLTDLPSPARPVCALALAGRVIHWSYSDVEGHVQWGAIFSYNLYKRDRAWKILLQTMHDDATT
jgi:hypothetical protein